ncbi:MAG: hypothetical protein ACK4IR_01000 [Thermosynechococcus sp.]
MTKPKADPFLPNTLNFSLPECSQYSGEELVTGDRHGGCTQRS